MSYLSAHHNKSAVDKAQALLGLHISRPII